MAQTANQEAGLDQAIGGQVNVNQGVGVEQGQSSVTDAMLQQALQEKENLQKVCFVFCSQIIMSLWNTLAKGTGFRNADICVEVVDPVSLKKDIQCSFK